MHAYQRDSAISISGQSARNSAIARLLDDAGSALDRDRDAARSFLRRASALLRAETEEAAAPTLAAAGGAGGGLAPWQANRVVKHIEAELGSKIRIVDLAALTRLSASYFARAFKRSLGEMPHSYILRRRVERAQKAMLATDEPLSHIALACGFADQAHMTRVFGRVVGRSPGAWRRDRREYDEGDVSRDGQPSPPRPEAARATARRSGSSIAEARHFSA